MRSKASNHVEVGRKRRPAGGIGASDFCSSQAITQVSHLEPAIIKVLLQPRWPAMVMVEERRAERGRSKVVHRHNVVVVVCGLQDSSFYAGEPPSNIS